MTKEKDKKLNVKGILILFGTLFTFQLLALATSFPLSTAPMVHAQDESTPSVRNLVREKVKEKLGDLIKKPQATIGSIAQITDHTIEVKTQIDQKTQLIATGDETKLFQITKGKRKEIKFEDLALSQNILAMGLKNDKGVLDGKRLIVLTDEPPLKNDKQVAYGNVSILGKNTLTVKHPKTAEERSIKVIGSTKITGKIDDGKIAKINFMDIKIGDRLVALGRADDKGLLTASSIHVITATPTP